MDRLYKPTLDPPEKAYRGRPAVLWTPRVQPGSLVAEDSGIAFTV